MIVLQDTIRDKPDAVFIWRTNISTMEEYTPDRLRAAGTTVARDLFRKQAPPPKRTSPSSSNPTSAAAPGRERISTPMFPSPESPPTSTWCGE